MRSILITGCSTGIGYHAAHTLKTQGWQVFATCRQQKDCDKLQAEGLNSFVLDYEKPATIKTAVETIRDRTGGTLDALFNNGAYAIPGAVEDLPVDGLRQIFEANVFGWHDLTRQVIPMMRAQGHGRIVQCSSVLGFIAVPWRGSYVASKFALEGLTDTLRLEMRDTDIHVSAIEPGPITTDFRKNARKQFDRWIDWENSPRATQYKVSLLPRLYDNDPKPDKFELGCEAVTQKLLIALESPRPRAHYYVTKPTWFAAIMKRILPQVTLDWIISGR